MIPSAVLVPLFRDGEGELRVVLVARGPAGLHGGQLGLPGGKRDPADPSLLATALRETQEEIGLGPDELEVLASLDPIDTRTTGFRVYPFLARIRPPGRWRFSAGEITGVLTPSVVTLSDRHARSPVTITAPASPEPRRVECVPLGEGHVLWGLTLRLLDRVLPRVMAGEWTI